MRVVFVIKRNDHKCSTLYFESCKGCSLSELAGSRVLSFREQVRNLRAQEFLRELVMGVVAPSDHAGSFLVKILYSVEGGDVEQVCSNLETNLPCLRLLFFLSLVFIYLAFFYFSSLYA